MKRTTMATATFKCRLTVVIVLYVLVLSRSGEAFVLGKGKNHGTSHSTGRRQQQPANAPLRSILNKPTVSVLRRRLFSLRSTSLEEETTESVTETESVVSSQPDSSAIVSTATATTTTTTTIDSSVSWLSEENVGLLVLLTVPMIWGTYVPVVRTLYEIEPAVPGFVFSAAYFSVASLSTLGLVAFSNHKEKDEQAMAGDEDDTLSVESNEDDPLLSTTVLAGMELGTYLFLGNSLQVLGLKTVPSDRAGFLVQLTTILVPLVDATLRGNLFAVPGRTWGACFLAFAGITVMGLDHGALADASSIMAGFSALGNGDLLILGSALMYTMHVVRLGKYAKLTTPLKLAASKATVELVLSVGLLASLVAVASSAATGDSVGAAAGGLYSFAVNSGREIQVFWETFTSGISMGTLPTATLQKIVAATLWTGWVSTAYTIYAQSYGQRRVSPTDANLIYSIQPIFTALFAFFLLGETMEPIGFVGGGLIGAAVFLVASKTVSPESEAAE